MERLGGLTTAYPGSSLSPPWQRLLTGNHPSTPREAPSHRFLYFLRPFDPPSRTLRRPPVRFTPRPPDAAFFVLTFLAARGFLRGRLVFVRHAYIRRG
jgi:hypothetical protein